jgi:hypothetical protein
MTDQHPHKNKYETRKRFTHVPDSVLMDPIRTSPLAIKSPFFSSFSPHLRALPVCAHLLLPDFAVSTLRAVRVQRDELSC